jgi:ribonuclease HI
MKPKSAAKRRLYEEAIPKLRAHGFTLLLQTQSLCIEAKAPCGRSFIVYPTTSSWMEKGLKRGSPARRSGKVGDFLAEYHRVTAAKASEDAEWSKLRPELTIFTDAALCPRTGASGWGAWMKGGGEASITLGGPIGDLLKSSTEAEIRAAANAFAAAKGRGLLRPGMVVMWQSDSLISLRWLLAAYPLSRDRPAKDGIPAGKPKSISPTQAASAGAAELARICASLKLKVLTRHVKGHQSGPNRQWVNRRCDEIAGEHMRARRLRHGSAAAKTEEAPVERTGT